MVEREGGDISYMDMLEVENLHSPVKEFFEKSVVFVTGATGFMGKVLIEKLLRSCPALPKMFILARAKKGKDIAERFKEQFADPLYERLRREQPDFLRKICFVAGDVGLLNLGLSEEDYKTISQEVNVFFHGAATVRFDERIQAAVMVNVRGTREALVLARKCTNLTAFLHISTAYSNCVVKDIDEKFYDPPIAADKLINLMETLDEELCFKICPILLGKFPNTYAFTKMVAESMVKDMSTGLPIAVMRPSIIVSSANEPVQGWIDNVYGPTGVIVGAAIGLLRTLHCNGKILADIIPVDYVINACIVAAYQVGKSHEAPNKEQLPRIENGWEDFGQKVEEREVPIYNYVSSNERPITWDHFMKITEKYGMEIPTTLCLWYYCFTLNKHKSLHQVYTFFLHILPAYVVDSVAYCIGKKPMLVNAYTKIHKFSDVISYFSTQQWQFQNRNVRELAKKLTPGDEVLFDFDISHLDWDDFFYTYVRGIRLYLVKDTFDTVEKGHRRYRLLKLLHYTVCSVLWLCFLRLCWCILQKIGLLS